MAQPNCKPPSKKRSKVEPPITIPFGSSWSVGVRLTTHRRRSRLFFPTTFGKRTLPCNRTDSIATTHSWRPRMMRSDLLRQRAQALRLWGLLAHWGEVVEAAWLEPLLQREEDERMRRSLEHRLKSAQ